MAISTYISIITLNINRLNFVIKSHRMVCVSAKLLQLCLTLCDPMNCSPLKLLCLQDSLKNIGVSCHALFQGIFPTQGLNLRPLGLLQWASRFFTTRPPGKPHGVADGIKKQETTNLIDVYKILHTKKPQNTHSFQVWLECSLGKTHILGYKNKSQ